MQILLILLVCLQAQLSRAVFPTPHHEYNFRMTEQIEGKDIIYDSGSSGGRRTSFNVTDQAYDKFQLNITSLSEPSHNYYGQYGIQCTKRHCGLHGSMQGTYLDLSNMMTYEFWFFDAGGDENGQKVRTHYSVYDASNNTRVALFYYKSDSKDHRFLLYTGVNTYMAFMFGNCLVSPGWNYAAFSFQYLFGQTQGLIKSKAAGGTICQQTITQTGVFDYTVFDTYNFTVIAAGEPNTAATGFRYGNEGWLTYMAIYKNFVPTTADFVARFAEHPTCLGNEHPCALCHESNNFECEWNNHARFLYGWWDFSDHTLGEWIPDAKKPSGQGMAMATQTWYYKDESRAPIKVPGQGIKHLRAYSHYIPQFQKLSKQYTIQAWIRQNPYSLTSGTTHDLVRTYQYDNSTKSWQYYFFVSVHKNQLSVTHSYSQHGRYNIPIPASKTINTMQWRFISIACVRLWDNESRVEATIDDYYLGEVILPNLMNDNQWYNASDTWKMTVMHGYGYHMERDFRWWNFPIFHADAKLNVRNGASCTQIVGHPYSCDQCPEETGQCIPMCDPNQYGDSCDPCYHLCGACTGPTMTQCHHCTIDATKLIIRGAQNNCTCDDGYYMDAAETCQPCHSNCFTCYGPSYEECTTCWWNKTVNATTEPKYFFAGVPGTAMSNYNCISNCSSNMSIADVDELFTTYAVSDYYTWNTTINGRAMCMLCHPYCEICDGPEAYNCSQCKPNYLLQNATANDTANGITGTICVTVCPDGQYQNWTLKECELCHSDCATCFNESNNACYTCTNSSLMMQDYECREQCDVGFWNQGGICTPCHDKCAACYDGSSTNCTACTNGHFLQFNGLECLDWCDSDQYADTTDNKCKNCHYSCKTCSGGSPADCIDCQDGWAYENFACVKECSKGNFEVNGVCMGCYSRASECFGPDPNQCLSCKDSGAVAGGWFLEGNECVDVCADGWYGDPLSYTCNLCKSVCATCTSWDYCTSCIEGPYQLNDGECSLFTCLSTEYRIIKPVLGCFECHERCKTCQGPTELDCLTCEDRYEQIGQSCLTCNEQPGFEEPKEEGVFTCVEICGDGYNFGNFPCDDGNALSGDGCSLDCVVEEGFTCTGGSPTTADVCTDTKKPSPKIQLIKVNDALQHEVFLTFDEEVMMNMDVDQTTLKLEIVGPDGPYDFAWDLSSEYRSANWGYQTKLILDVKQSLFGYEYLRITFKVSETYIDSMGNGLNTAPLEGGLQLYEYIDPMTRIQLEAGASSGFWASMLAMGLNFGFSIVFGGSLAAMWTMVNTIQLLSLMPLISVDWPILVKLVFKKMLSSHGEVSFLPNMIFDALPFDDKDLEPLNEHFNLYGWTTCNFLALSGRKILLWLCLIAVFPFVAYMNGKYATKHRYCRFWKTLRIKYEYSLLLRAMIMSYVSMFLAAFLGLYKGQFNNMANVVSVFVAITFVIVLLYLPIMIMNILQRNYKKITKDKFMTKYSTILRELHLTSTLKYMYYPVFLLRRVAFALTLVLMADSTVSQLAVLIFQSSMMTFYVVLIKPQQEKVMLVLTALGEILMITLTVMCYGFLGENIPATQKDALSYVFLMVVFLYISSNWVIVAMLTYKDIKKKMRAKRIVKRFKDKFEDIRTRDKITIAKLKKARKDKANLLKNQAHAMQDKATKGMEDIQFGTQPGINVGLLDSPQKPDPNLEHQLEKEAETGGFTTENPFYNPSMAQELVRPGSPGLNDQMAKTLASPGGTLGTLDSGQRLLSQTQAHRFDMPITRRNQQFKPIKEEQEEEEKMLNQELFHE